MYGRRPPSRSSKSPRPLDPASLQARLPSHPVPASEPDHGSGLRSRGGEPCGRYDRAVAGKSSALITGGAGFIGSHLSELLLADGWEVYALDDLSTGLGRERRAPARATERLPPRRRLGALAGRRSSELVHKCDVVYHLAAAVGVRLIVEQPVHTMVTNIQGTETVLDYCSRFGKRVLIASTSEVYGDHREERPLAEEDRRIYGPTTQKRWLYADSKAIDEFLALALPPGARPRLRDRAALQHRRPAAERPVRDGDPALRPERARRRADRGARRRHADALASATSRTRSARSKGLMDERSISGEIFNVGSTERVTILELAERVRAQAGSRRSSSSSRTTRSTGSGSRTRCTASRRSRRSARRSAGGRPARSTRSSPT